MAVSSFASVPDTAHYWLANARIPLALLTRDGAPSDPIPWLAAAPQSEDLVAVNIEIKGGAIATLTPASLHVPEGAAACDLHQGLVWPCFVDIHTHLDKSHTWHRTANPSGTFEQALKQIDIDRIKYWRSEDLYRRMEFALKCAYAHGTRALRTHLDALDDQAEISFSVFRTLRQEWAGRLELQAASLLPIEAFETDQVSALADLVAESSGILGAVAYPNPNLDQQLDQLFQLAQTRGLDLDLHVDENLNPAAMALRHVAQAKLRNGYSGTVVCGHCCSLSVQSWEVAAETIRWVKKADIGVISLPMCNLFLQDRQIGRMPRRRGVTLLPELKAQGVPVAFSSDNTRDVFYAYGDLDGLEVFTQAVRIGQLDRPIGDWPQAVTATPAAMMGLKTPGTLAVGQPADLVCFKARTFNELLSRPQCDRIVLRQGKAIDTTLPDYVELDDLLDR
ncbi:cytosine deaminase [Pseudanabaena sp. FACHB-2040]|uniref:cytosine deaminase n=1 Tax=Pseudanabaena sp. FACHB-2040 TaxID=2692859 RepID=UPI001685AAF0|nr:cytosine deaminase [Pseudanabaena sp. FACHB-2040]MBD2260029.1 cytosine deaminase [Pseudanabaena sp. FACHB-2040]